MLFFFFFFVKQKTAYEMRISDWSSDVCSSELAQASRHSGEVGLEIVALDMRAKQAETSLEYGARARIAVPGQCGGRDAAMRRPARVHDLRPRAEIGSASCRERVCPYVSISVVDGSLKKKRTSSDIHI